MKRLEDMRLGVFKTRIHANQYVKVRANSATMFKPITHYTEPIIEIFSNLDITTCSRI